MPKPIRIGMGEHAVKAKKVRLVDKMAEAGTKPATIKRGNKTVLKSVAGLEKDKEYYEKCLLDSQILGNGLYLSMDARFTQRNYNTVVYGGSGTGKSRFYVKPNILNMNGSYVITDPSGELFQDMSGGLEKSGYKIKVLNLSEMNLSMRYNPFYYVRSTKDIPALVDVMVANIEGPKKSGGGDGKFWDLSTSALLCGIMGYLYEAYPLEQRTFTNVLALLKMTDLDKAAMDPNYKSGLDLLMENWDEQTNGESYAVQQYKVFKMASEKTAGNILISTAVLFGKFFDLPELANLTCRDEMELDKIGEEKTALFLIIPVGNKTYNFLTSVLCSQLLQVLYQTAERRMVTEKLTNPTLKVHTTFLLDELNNIGTIPNIDLYLATCRKYGIGIVCIFQAQSQIESNPGYKEFANDMVGNCDTMIYLGGAEPKTLKMLIERLGKKTITTYNNSTSKGRGGSYSESMQRLGRNVMDANELSEMDNEEMIAFVRGVKPQKVEKFPLQFHPNYYLSAEADPSMMRSLDYYDMEDKDCKEDRVLIISMRSEEEKNKFEKTGTVFMEKGNDTYMESAKYLASIKIIDPEPYFTLQEVTDKNSDPEEPKKRIELQYAYQDEEGNPIPYIFPHIGSGEFLFRRKGAVKERGNAPVDIIRQKSLKGAKLAPSAIPESHDDIAFPFEDKPKQEETKETKPESDERPAPVYLTEEQKKQHLEAMEVMKKPPVPIEELFANNSNFTMVHPELMYEFSFNDLEDEIDTEDNPIFHVMDDSDGKIPETQEEVFGDYYKPAEPPIPADQYEDDRPEGMEQDIPDHNSMSEEELIREAAVQEEMEKSEDETMTDAYIPEMEESEPEEPVSEETAVQEETAEQNKSTPEEDTVQEKPVSEETDVCAQTETEIDAYISEEENPEDETMTDACIPEIEEQTSDKPESEEDDLADVPVPEEETTSEAEDTTEDFGEFGF